ncbi:hypothetical protein C8R43DRAFT_1128056 [Mycena crocata]|nr:hypothetical protein C8R43DRAFT_1128056 [Mycena crocata]
MPSLVDLNADVTMEILQTCARHQVAPWQLAHVCQSWRRVAFRSKRLWSNVRADQPGEERCRRRVAAELALCVDCDVTVKFRAIPGPVWYTNTSSAEKQCMKEVLAMLAARSADWRKADLTLNMKDFFDLGKFPHNRFPKLQHLMITIWGYQNAMPDADHQPFTVAPMLGRLEICGGSSACPLVPVGQLTRLDVHWTNDSHNLLLANTSYLEVLRLRGGEEPEAGTRPASLPRLHTLQVPTTAFLDLLDPPALRTFELLRDTVIWLEDTAPWFRLLSRFPKLDLTTVHVVGVQDSTIAWLRSSLANSPTSTLIFTITAQSIPAGRLLRALEVPNEPATQVIAPRVDCMEVRLFRGGQDWQDTRWRRHEERGAHDEPALLKMVRSRLATGVSGSRSLRRLVVAAKYFDKGGELRQQVGDLQKQGLDVDLSAWGEESEEEDEESDEDVEEEEEVVQEDHAEMLGRPIS